VVPKNFAKGGKVSSRLFKGMGSSEPKNKSRAVSIKSLLSEGRISRFDPANVDSSSLENIDKSNLTNANNSGSGRAMTREEWSEFMAEYRSKVAPPALTKEVEEYYTRDNPYTGGWVHTSPLSQSWYNLKYMHGIETQPTISRDVLRAWGEKHRNAGHIPEDGPHGVASFLTLAIRGAEKKIAMGASGAWKESLEDRITMSYLGIEEMYNKYFAQKEDMAEKSRSLSRVATSSPAYFAKGDLAKGTDIIPAMLTPGEFVMTKHAVDNYGVDNLRAINSGAAPGNSVYNGYNINVNVKSNSNPDQIANAVMTQIRQVNAQQVRGNRFNG
jgi:hypothetical protein